MDCDSKILERRLIMKRFWSAIALVLTLTIGLVFSAGQPAFAADAAAGGRVFSANCAACHMGGGNVVNAAKTLKKADLEANGMLSSEAIVAQVTKGKNAMPMFQGKLSPDDMENVAAYVLAQAEAGW